MATINIVLWLIAAVPVLVFAAVYNFAVSNKRYGVAFGLLCGLAWFFYAIS